MTGHIVLYTGPMFAGKTTRLLDAVSYHDDVAVYKPAIDDRYDETAVITHDGGRIEATVVDSVSGIDPDASVVAIDEAQFFDHDLVERVQSLRDAGKRVFIAGLLSDFRGEGFEPVPTLRQHADVVEGLVSSCAVCDSDATHTQRLIDGDPAPRDAPTVDVGADDRYEPRCSDCHELGEDE